FLYFFSFYLLMLILKVDWRLAALGAIAFGFSTYLVIILGVGHNAKAHAIGYMPLLLGGVFLCLKKRYITGFLLTAIAMGLELHANHFQMTYYLFLLIGLLVLFYAVTAFKEQQFNAFLKSLGVLMAALLLGLSTNASQLLSTREYSQFSTRGSNDISITVSGEEQPTSTGLDYDYITEYSYGITESLNLIIPRAMGGGSREYIGEDSAFYAFLRKMGVPPKQAIEFAEAAPTYWGDQTIVEAPAYLGISVVFLAVLAFLLLRGPTKWWLITGIALALLLSYGKNFDLLTRFFVDYVPFYNKFRAVSSIQVIIELCLPILAILGLSAWIKSTDKEQQFKALKQVGMYFGGFLVLLLLAKNTIFDFVGENDAFFRENYGIGFVNALAEDRQAMFTNDLLRGLAIIAVVFGALFLSVQEKINHTLLVVVLALVISIDLVGIDRNYVNNEDFVAASTWENYFQPNEADQVILKDTSDFRVLDLSANPFNSSRASYFHKSVGGYHGAKPYRAQNIYAFYLSKNHLPVINMLNVKYFIGRDDSGIFTEQNPDAFGSAWFVEGLQQVENANAALLALDSITTAVAFAEAAVVDRVQNSRFAKDSTAQIVMKEHRANRLVYEFSTPNPAFAVFSEMYYPHGWQAFVNGKEVPIYQVNYLLRGLEVPEASGEIVFEFNPEVVKTGSTIALASNILLGICLLLGGFFYFKRKPST
ncbi:MAG: hypothetical protein RQ756_08095, partial [Flavobacteriaceae bacterium]|nr:hypothetical protein [Flavobacteriaceae bacterium]